MNIVPPISTGSAAGARAPNSRTEKIGAAATEFEAMLIGQMLHSSKAGLFESDSDQAGSTLLEMSEQQFAKIIAANGGLGLAKLVSKGLGKDAH